MTGAKIIDRLPMVDLFFNMDPMYEPNGPDELLKGLIMQKGNKVDLNFPDAVREKKHIVCQATKKLVSSSFLL